MIRQTIQNTIQNTINVFDPIKPVTQGMTLTESWDRGVYYSTIASARSLSVRVDATINNTDSGILIEAGATTHGMALYVYSGVLYLQCGDGGGFGAADNRVEISYTLPVGEFNYIIEFSVDSSSSAFLYINGLVVGSQNFNHDFIAGSDKGTSGQVATAVAINRGGWASSGQGFYTNEISKCYVFRNQTTSDV